MKKIKKNYYLLAALLMLFFTGIFIHFIVNAYIGTPRNALECYEKTWSIDLPDDLKEIYDQKPEASFHGDGARFTVFKTGAQDAPFYSDFSEEANPEMEERVQTLLSGLAVPTQRRLAFEKGYQWKEMQAHSLNSIDFIVSADRTRLFVVEWIV